MKNKYNEIKKISCTRKVKNISLYPHFNPVEHKIESKIATVRSSHHCKFNINYHLIWIPKYRKHILKGKVKDVLATIIEGICHDLKLNMLALEVMPDHLHLFVGAKPTHNPATIVKRLKGNTSIQLRRCFFQLKYLGYKNPYKKFKNLWARGYYCGSAGHVSQEQVKRYIQEQMGKSLFEYDTTKSLILCAQNWKFCCIYGCPEHMKGQMKIGDFTK